MLLRSVTSFYVQSKNGDKLICSLRGSSAFPSSSTLSSPPRKHGRNSGVYASIDASNLAFTGVVFQPFEKVKEELHIPIAPFHLFDRVTLRTVNPPLMNSEQIKRWPFTTLNSDAPIGV
ncbi:hypothetical protein V6N13_041306 [Hibiscus sabdariffa]|uniref:Uncharacterized protein n=1 Tax=Hibiscus sabdariffa TaxID=183260 RepID=A0ABR2RAY1_9ROSI